MSNQHGPNCVCWTCEQTAKSMDRLAIAADDPPPHTFRIAVEALRIRIQADVQSALDAFKHETGVMPSDITIRMADVGDFGSQAPVPVLAGVQLEFKF